MRTCGAGRRRGRRENLDRVETWAFALTEASPRMARLDEVDLAVLSLDGVVDTSQTYKPTISS